MATADRELSIVIKAVVDGLVGPVRTADKEIKTFAANTTSALDQIEERSENLRHVWKSLFEAFIGVEIVDVLKKIADGANDAAERLEIAANTARNFGNSIDPNAMEKWLQAFAASSAGGGFALPDMRQGVQTFAASGLDSNQIKRATEDATNLAATFGVSLPESVHIVNQALTGHVEMLSRYGIISREAAKNIHTVEEAMQALEKASAGGAEKRADGLAGAFGRMTNSIQNLGNAFGQYLIPYFTASANAIDHIADAFNKLPDGVKQAAAGISFATVSLAALGLMLPAVKLGIEFIGNAFALLGTPVGIAINAVKTFADVVGGPLLSVIGTVSRAFITLAVQGAEMLAQSFLKVSLTAIRGSLMGALEAVGSRLLALLGPIGAVIAGWVLEAAAAVSAWLATIAPIAAVIAALALIGLAIYEIVKHWDAFKSGAAAALNWVGDRIHDFIEFTKHQFAALGSILHGVWDFLTGNKAQGLEEMKAGLGGVVGGWKAVGAAAFEAGKKGVEAVNGWLQSQGWFRSAENMIKGFFSGSTGAAPVIPKESFSGDIPGGAKGAGGKSTADSAAKDAMANFDEQTKNWLQSFADRVDEAKHILEKSKAALDNFKNTLTDGKPQTQAQADEEAKLVTNELRAQQKVHDTLVAQHNAEVKSAQQYLEAAKAVSPHLKNHDELVRSALNSAREHHKAAEQIAEEYLRIAGTISTLVHDRKQVYIDLHEHVIKDRDANAQTQVDDLTRQIDLNLNQRADKQASLENTHDLASEKGQLSVAEEAAYKLQLAQLAAANAQDREALAKHIAAIYDEIAARKDATLEEKNRAKDADNAATTAHREYLKAVNDVTVATVKYQQALDSQRVTLQKLLDGVAQKLGIPGLGMNAAGTGLSFNPMTFLIEAFSQTKSFGDIMGLVNQLMKVFAQLLDSLRPVLDVVLTVVRSVANVFIFLYNTVARILRLFGIHLQLLDQINGAYQNQIPLIQITHNIPTLNELAAGKLNSPLSNTPQGYNSLQNIGNVHTTLLQTIIGILGAILVVESISKRGGGIASLLSGLFHMGGGGGLNMSGVAPTADLVSGMPAVDMSGVSSTADLVNSMSGSVAQGLGMDGSSMSGGLFTATNNAMQAASPVLAMAIGSVLGSMVGGGGGMSSLFGGIGSMVGESMGGPVGGILGGIVGGLVGSLFGGHKHSSAPPPTPQNTGFTDLLHSGTDVHTWLGLNELNTAARSAARSMQTASNAMNQVAQTLQKVTAATSAAADVSFNQTMRIGTVNLHNDLEVADLSRTLGNDTQRILRSYQYGLGRAPLG